MRSWSNVAEVVRILVTDGTTLRLEHRVLKKQHALISSQIRNTLGPTHILGAKYCPVCYGTGSDKESLCATCKGLGRL